MTAQIRTQSFVRNIPYIPGSVASIELSRGSGDIESLLMDLYGTFTYPAGATGSLNTLKAQALISRIEVVVDGKTTVLSVPGWAFGVASDRTFDGTGGGAVNTMTVPAANAAGTLSTQFYVDFMQFDGVKPKESNLRVRNASVVELKITFAPWTAVFTNAASVPAVFSVGVDVHANHCTELEPDVAKPSFLLRRMSQVISAASSNSNHEVRLPAGNLIRSVKIFTHINGVASDSILNSVVARNGLDTRVSSSWRGLTLRQRGYKAEQTGMVEIDFARQNRGDVLLSNAWAVPTPSEPVLILDYTGGAGRTVELVITEYVKG